MVYKSVHKKNSRYSLATYLEDLIDELSDEFVFASRPEDAPVHARKRQKTGWEKDYRGRMSETH